MRLSVIRCSWVSARAQLPLECVLRDGPSSLRVVLRARGVMLGTAVISFLSAPFLSVLHPTHPPLTVACVSYGVASSGTQTWLEVAGRQTVQKKGLLVAFPPVLSRSVLPFGAQVLPAPSRYLPASLFTMDRSGLGATLSSPSTVWGQHEQTCFFLCHNVSIAAPLISCL